MKIKVTILLMLLVSSLCGCFDEPVNSNGLTNTQAIHLLSAEADKRGLKWKISKIGSTQDQPPTYEALAVPKTESFAIGKERVSVYWLTSENATEGDAAYSLYRKIQGAPKTDSPRP